MRHIRAKQALLSIMLRRQPLLYLTIEPKSDNYLNTKLILYFKSNRDTES